MLKYQNIYLSSKYIITCNYRMNCHSTTFLFYKIPICIMLPYEIVTTKRLKMFSLSVNLFVQNYENLI